MFRWNEYGACVPANIGEAFLSARDLACLAATKLLVTRMATIRALTTV